ncbi:MAG: class I adenylate-forming enzyme family protein [Bacillota bacterium]
MAELLHRMLERNAHKYPDTEALVDPAAGVRWSWAELDRLATRAALGLQAQGLKRGDRAILFMPNRPEMAVGLFAVWKAGGVVVPVNPRFTAFELAHVVRNSEARLVVHDPALGPVATAAAEQAGNGATVLAAGALLEPGDLPAGSLPTDLTMTDLAELIYTSGTTGAPKGAALTHAAIATVSAMFAYELNIRPGDRVLSLMPMTHSAVLNLTVLGAVYAGAVNVIGNYTPPLLAQYVQQERCTHFFGAPVAYFMTAKMVPNLSEYDLSSMKAWAYGGAPMSREQVLAVRAKFGPNLYCVYGLTEAGPNGTLLEPADQVEHAGSVGRRATVNVDLRIVDDAGSDVGLGELGEVLLKTPTAMVGYWKNEQATRDTMKDGWIHTGDLARRDEDGFIYIVDRKKDLIITGGVNVYPREVEEVLATHPAVEECSVVGIPHAEWGETVVAVYVPKGGAQATADELRSHCEAKLAGYKVPRLYEPVEALPRNSNGKILKHELRKRFV